jgi:hypothetical protein
MIDKQAKTCTHLFVEFAKRFAHVLAVHVDEFYPQIQHLEQNNNNNNKKLENTSQRQNEYVNLEILRTLERQHLHQMITSSITSQHEQNNTDTNTSRSWPSRISIVVRNES